MMICSARMQGMPKRNTLCSVLWCHTFMPSSAPILPPKTERSNSVFSGMRRVVSCYSFSFLGCL